MTLGVIAPGEHGCVNGGTEVISSETRTYVCNGTNGSNGSDGAAGIEGPVGPAGSQGSAGPAGKVELVTCKTVKQGKKSAQKCTTKLVSGAVKFTTTGSSEHATLSRRGVVFAAGMAVTVNRGHLGLRLTPLRKLRPGRYTLTLIGGSGSRRHIRSESFTLS
ncbi:MAG: collagen-like triple helix repeat-containing protein [Solirubrobacteraceae bacterium]